MISDQFHRYPKKRGFRETSPNHVRSSHPQEFLHLAFCYAGNNFLMRMSAKKSIADHLLVGLRHPRQLPLQRSHFLGPPPPPPPAKMDSILSTRERSRTFVSRLQAPSSGAFSYVDVDVYRPCSVSILSNPSFSSSHQDKLWEEQAEIYSSGGRGTPGREDDDDDKVRAGDKAAAAQPAPPPQTLLFNLHHSPLPGFGSTHHQHHEQHPGFSNPSLRRSALGSGSLRSPSSESGHFMQQIMSKIRGSSPKRVSSSTATITTRAAPGSCPTSQLEIAKRRNPWSSCICFSVKS